jgi:hypothetical protein
MSAMVMACAWWGIIPLAKVTSAALCVPDAGLPPVAEVAVGVEPAFMPGMFWWSVLPEHAARLTAVAMVAETMET